MKTAGDAEDAEVKWKKKLPNPRVHCVRSGFGSRDEPRRYYRRDHQ